MSCDHSQVYDHSIDEGADNVEIRDMRLPSSLIHQYANRICINGLSIIKIGAFIRMGNRGDTIKPKVSDQQLQHAVNFVISYAASDFVKSELEGAIGTILAHIHQYNPFARVEGCLKVNDQLIRLFFSPSFPNQMMKMLKQLSCGLRDLNKKSLIFVGVPQLSYLTNLSNLILFFSNDSVISLFDSLMVRSDIDSENKATIREMEKLSGDGNLEAVGDMVSKLTSDEVDNVEKCLRVTIYGFITSRQQAIGPSARILQHLSSLEQSLFMLYCKIYFSRKSPSAVEGVAHEVSRERAHFSRNLIIAAYFLASGSNKAKPSIYEIAVLFVYSLLNVNLESQNQNQGISNSSNLKAIKALPSHLFKGLPVFQCVFLYEYILCNTLYALKYITEGRNQFVRFIFNRLQSIKLVDKMIQELSLVSQSITYYLEELCLQVKPGQIERTYLVKVAKVYLSMQSSRSVPISSVLKTFVEKGSHNYNLKFCDKSIRITGDELLTELEDEEDLYSKQSGFYIQKFVHESILLANMFYSFQDRQIWNEIIPGILMNKEDSQLYEEKQKPYHNSSDEEQLNQYPRPDTTSNPHQQQDKDNSQQKDNSSPQQQDKDNSQQKDNSSPHQQQDNSSPQQQPFKQAPLEGGQTEKVSP